MLQWKYNVPIVSLSFTTVNIRQLCSYTQKFPSRLRSLVHTHRYSYYIDLLTHNHNGRQTVRVRMTMKPFHILSTWRLRLYTDGKVKKNMRTFLQWQNWKIFRAVMDVHMSARVSIASPKTKKAYSIVKNYSYKYSISCLPYASLQRTH